MGAGKFTKTDSDLLGLLQGNRSRVIRKMDETIREDKTDTLDRLAALRQEAVDLRNELLSDLNGVQGQIDTLSFTLNGDVEAEIPGLASLVENLRLIVTALPNVIDEDFVYASTLDVADGIKTFQESIDSFIRRGYLNDPGGGDPTFGIAVGRNLSFTVSGEPEVLDGKTYYELASNQTLGLYTSTGWQFWIDGVKVGWFESSDGMLHVPEIKVVDVLNLGDNWRITTNGGFGLKYVGA